MKNNRQMIQHSTIVSLSILALSACASQAKAPLSADTNAKVEIEKTELAIQSLEQKQYNLLAPEHFKLALDSKNAAKEKLSSGDKNAKVLSDIAISEEAVSEVARIGDANAATMKDVLLARQHALDAKAQDFDQRQFHSTDNELADLGHDMEKNNFVLDAKKTSKLELRYGKSEIDARKALELHDAKNIIKIAEKAKASNKTPLLLEQANAKIAAAEHAIELSPHTPAGYETAVLEANTMAKKLTEVLAIANQNNTSEQVAQSLWDKNRELVSSKAELVKANSDAQNVLDSANQEATAEKQKLENRIQDKDASLADQKITLTDLKTENKQYANQEELKQRIEEIKSTFSPDEAEVMKDGKNIVVRLKKMNFSSGHSELNPNSFETLKKVDTLIAAVPTNQITVEGHTDSLGANNVNKTLSEARAESVKKYLMSQNFPEQLQVDTVGYGSEKPLTTNKTKNGRATNRRVDIVIQTSEVL